MQHLIRSAFDMFVFVFVTPFGVTKERDEKDENHFMGIMTRQIRSQRYYRGLNFAELQFNEEGGPGPNENFSERQTQTQLEAEV